MGLNDLASGERLHIGFFGMRNAGKSSLVNALTGQTVSLVSKVKGTTTDPVKKAMELLPLGPVVILDTPGFDDEGELGEMRVKRTMDSLGKTDIAVLVIDGTVGYSDADRKFTSELTARGIPYIVAISKADEITERAAISENEIYVSGVTSEGIDALKAKLGDFQNRRKKNKPLVSDLVEPRDTVVLVTPIDEAAPKGRIILPQQMVLRELLDSHASAIVCQPQELSQVLSGLTGKPRLVITDSQVFSEVASIIPRDLPLTSFSILMARYKGELPELILGASVLKELKDGDPVLISEACTHHRQCNDIGTVKMPGWIEAYSGAKPRFHFSSGQDFPEDPSGYKLIVHCGGCMINEAEMKHRQSIARNSGVPMVNYGVAIAAMHGILDRSLEVFK